MSDSIVLVCAVLAAMASGVLMAYWACLGFFRMVRMRPAQAATKPAAVVAPPVLQG